MSVRILTGDCRTLLSTLPDESVHCCVTSPPYFGLRDYGCDGQIGLEQTPDAFVAELVAVFREVRRVLRDDGTLWLNLGDSYASSTKGSGGTGKSTLGAASGGNGISPEGIARSQDRQAMDVRRIACGLADKQLIGIPWRVAFALQADGWYLRQDIIWSKPNPMPESVRDRCTKAHEYLFLLSKSPRYYFDAEAIAEAAGDKPAGNGFAGRQGGAGGRPMSGGKGTEERWTPAGSRRSNSFARRTATTPPPGQVPQHRPDREDVDYSGTRNKRSVWEVATQPFKEAHFATFPPALIEPCVAAGCPAGGTVLDPFGGAGTTGLVADRMQRDAVLIELNPEYAEIARRRIVGDAPLFAEVGA